MVRLKRIIEYLRRKPPRSTDRNFMKPRSKIIIATSCFRIPNSRFRVESFTYASLNCEEVEGYNSWIMNS
ncbi:hypothetical protein HanRHA438_Chr01g0041481 [Helianthus annuus]|uniref:Uncharacterized protein n=1 Tax=Helianthus annuus TaxID=4232 RepID=A0A251VT53_HELAN|nr:hypothetical protein HanXRQr2_Chr01g0040641 [Helianthus annuus]KAJ0612963.1 hypothetical protein HanHA300_Chr01g0033091 [Helianthus annuus]KAJ0624624.1 hypothetical protein HanIR_Chr01g0045071 [Helianthus annuus]KAJ0628351.1 hypothetical protein HanHA89_Chr01g0035651 [Helianthus annuus]KAJ0949700.1 hypothetical protein HanRHA438_Chr01g0041481 [Helianthus annuus]